MERYRLPGVLLAVGLALACLLLAGRPGEAAAAGDTGFLVRLQPLTGGLAEPTAITHAGDGRLFVLERAGTIRIIAPGGKLQPQSFLDLSDRVGWEDNWEQGLLGLAFHPDYAANGFFFVNYTDLQGDTRIARFQVDAANPDQADPDSELNVLTIPQPTVIHNGGGLAFGPDGYLYIGLGDGGWLSDPANRGQNLSTYLGKLLRIDVSVADVPPAYTIPSDNPFAGVPGAAGEIWALGLRNPWRFSFDRETGDLFIADVGNFRMEEVNFEPAGSSGGVNYGWRCFEGYLPFVPDGCGPDSNYTFPIHAYGHDDLVCAIIGGHVYRGSLYPAMSGAYLFTDLCSRDIWSLRPAGTEWTVAWHGHAPAGLSTFGEANNRELYAASYETGTLYRVRGVPADDSYLPQMAHRLPIPTPTPLPAGPDLVVQDVTVVPVSPAAGQAALILVTVLNAGNQPVPAGNNFYVDLYVDRLPAPYVVGDISWGAQGSAYGPGQSVTYSATYTFSAGSHELYMQVDTDNNVAERLENNNVFGPLPVNVQP